MQHLTTSAKPTTPQVAMHEPKPSPLPPPAYTARDAERFHPEALRPNDERSPFEIDRSRIIHCAAFRRLQGKTQIFGVAHDNFFRTRLTHSLEVAQIAKGIALAVGAGTELVEAISLAHDIGHPPFGHAGEQALHAAMQECGYGPFESNAQNLRTLAYLETKKRTYPGLNLTRATLDGLLKHKVEAGAILAPVAYASERDLVAWVTHGVPERETALETQIVDWADQVAYSVHDLEDGVHAGLITSARLSDEYLEQLIIPPPSGDYTQAQMEGTYRWLTGQVRAMEEMGDARERAAARKDLTSSLIHRFVTAAKVKPRKLADGTAGQGRYALKLVIAPAERGRALVLKAIAQRLIIHDQRVATLERRSRVVVRRLFGELVRCDAVDLYPDEFRGLFLAASDDSQRARVACDYIASMTDRYAEMLYQRLFSPGTGTLMETM
jgi:dGTPase